MERTVIVSEAKDLALVLLGQILRFAQDLILRSNLSRGESCLEGGG
jgi:hypothetical protein